MYEVEGPDPFQHFLEHGGSLAQLLGIGVHKLVERLVGKQENEFRAARQAAEAVGAQLLLGDMPREIMGVTSSLKVSGPPASFDFREATDSTTRELVAARYPELLDLVQEGTLVAVPRPADYHERRTDGYQEPELVFVVGTAHVSTKSAEDVRRVITAVEPDNVVVELCRSRAAIMYDDAQDAQDAGSQGRAAGDGNSTASTSGRSGAQAINPMSLSGGSLPQAFQRTLQLGGSPALMLRLALGQLSKRLSARVGVRTGEDVRAARQAAEAVGAELVLGDRPIEITLERAWNALSWRRKAQLAWALFQGVTRAEHERIDQDLVEALKADDVISATFADISEQYPEVVSPLVHERDLYLAWSLKRSKAVNGKRCVDLGAHIR
ncbi:hypothetical protein WJX72_006314 [[Myrmecia] bisecta]|uniref:TraB family protein n=1 Tax=[Myrmecia] bisecta TaxID=41462 RepID=A0AAW1R7J3_9CHLO